MGQPPRNRRERRAAGKYKGFAKGKGKTSEHWMAEVQREQFLKEYQAQQAHRFLYGGIYDEIHAFEGPK